MVTLITQLLSAQEVISTSRFLEGHYYVFLTATSNTVSQKVFKKEVQHCNDKKIMKISHVK